jgi:methylated-DNA-protein-cysteine methyltransferase related protein
MPKSEAFIKIKADILEITKHIPAGHVTTFAAIADYLNVVPHHVAYILSTLSHEEADEVPWHRVVADGGAIKAGSRGASQKERLEAEGLSFDNTALENFENVWLEPNKLVPWKRKTGRYTERKV